MGILYSDDLDRFQLNQFKEAAKLRGTQVVFLKTLSEKKDIYTDIDIIPSEMPIYIDILFEQFPQNKRTLQREGWYNKDKEENNPITLQVPLDLEILSQWQIVLFPNKTQDALRYWKPYQITKISTRVEHPHFYTCAAVPYFIDKSPTIDRKENIIFLTDSDLDV